MPQRSSVDLLPEAIRAELNRRLVAGAFSDYEGLTAWLNEQGCEISKSSVHRHGVKFEEQLTAIRVATEQATAIAQAVGDEPGLLGDALTRVYQEKAFKVLVDMDMEGADIDFVKLGRSIADINRSGVMQKKWQAETRAKVGVAADDVVKTVKQAGLSEAKAAEIRRMILGIV